MDWTNDMVLEFLHAYETEPIIWDLRQEDRKKKCLVAEAWRRVHKKLDWECSIEDLKKKKDSLMAYYRVHSNKAKKIKMSDEGCEEEYKTSWFAFETMNSFLGDIYDESNATCTEEARAEKTNQHNRIDYLESDNDSYEIELSEPSRQIKVPTLGKKERDFSKTKPRISRCDVEISEAELYGKLLTEKLMQLDREDRLKLMNAIDNLVFDTTMNVMTRDTCKANNTPAPSSSQICSGDAKRENYIFQMVKSSPTRAEEDPFD